MLTGTARCDAGLPAGSPAGQRANRNRESTIPAAVRLYGISIAVISCAALVFAVLRPVQVLPLLRSAPPVTLRDADGATIASAHLGGTILIFQLSALRCPGPCEDGHAALQTLQRRLEASPPPVPVRLVTVLLDGNAPPASLRARRAALGADRRWWQVATASAGQLKDAIGAGFGVYYAVHSDERVAFEPATFLVDPRGILRAQYRTASPDPTRIGRDLDLVVREALSRGAARAMYAAAHLFLCYPR